MSRFLIPYLAAAALLAAWPAQAAEVSPDLLASEAAAELRAPQALAALAANTPLATPFHGGHTLALRDLMAAPEMATDLALANLADGANRCAIALETASGDRMMPTVTFQLLPRETRPYLDVFQAVAVRGATAAQARLSCERDFTAYAVLADRGSDRIEVASPEDDDGNGPIAELATNVPPCPTGALCFDAPGVDQVPAPPPGNPVGRVQFPAPPGVVNRFVMTIDVQVGPWYPQQPSGKHLIYWFVISKNIDMPGLLYFLGPPKSLAFARHGIGLKHPQKKKIKVPFAAIVGDTYHVDNDYDMAGRSYDITITNTGSGNQTVLHGLPNVTSYTIVPGKSFFVDMGFFPGKVPDEVPSYGWVYSNVHIEVYQQ